MSNEFTLQDVVSDRILDPVTGWRDRLPDEYIKLNDAQKQSFLELFGKGCRQNTKNRLEVFISDPYRYGPMLSHNWFYDRVGWVGDKCMYCAGQDYPTEIATIRKIIVG